MAKSTSKAKAKTSKHAKAGLPLAPWIYINDTTRATSEVADALSAFIPETSANHLAKIAHTNIDQALQSADQNTLPGEALIIFAGFEKNQVTAAHDANYHREAAIRHGHNFASVNITSESTDDVASGIKPDWGTNHLHLKTSGGIQKTAEFIFKWLFKVLSVRETLYLIPEKDMYAIDRKSFPDYDYCPINESRKRAKDAKIQFVALIASKPEVGPDQRLHWKVVDRTGEANFYFQHRGPDSKPTWDWVLALQPGDRKALPRMPMVLIKEKKRVTIAKAPFRGVAMVVGGTGLIIKGAGHGLCWLGRKVSMGPSGGQWVAEADIGKDGKVKTVTKVASPVSTRKEIKVFNDNGEKVWKDEDDTASTTAGSFYDEKTQKEFC